MSDTDLRRALNLASAALQSVAKTGERIDNGSMFKINGHLYSVREILNRAGHALGKPPQDESA